MFQKNSFPASLFSRSRQVSQMITRTFHETITKKSPTALRPDTLICYKLQVVSGSYLITSRNIFFNGKPAKYIGAHKECKE